MNDANGLLKVEPQITKSSRERTSALIKLRPDSIIIKFSTVKAWNLMFLDQVNTHKDIEQTLRLQANQRIECGPKTSLDQELSNSQEVKRWGAPQSLIPRKSDSRTRASQLTFTSVEPTTMSAQVHMWIWKIQWSRRVSIWVWSTVTSYDQIKYYYWLD